MFWIFGKFAIYNTKSIDAKITIGRYWYAHRIGEDVNALSATGVQRHTHSEFEIYSLILSLSARITWALNMWTEHHHCRQPRSVLEGDYANGCKTSCEALNWINIPDIHMYADHHAHVSFGIVSGKSRRKQCLARPKLSLKSTESVFESLIFIPF